MSEDRLGTLRSRRLRLRRRLRALGSGISYTRVFEDGETDRRALAIEPGARVPVIASAGDRALDAVVWGAGQVIAVDPVAAQLRLTALKVAAAGVLESADLVAMFSLGRHEDARRLYASLLRPRLASGDQRYWDDWIGLFQVGIHDHHPLGLAVAVGGAALRMVGGRTLRSMIEEAADAATQGRLYESRLRRHYWNPVTRWILGRNSAVRWFAANRDPELAIEDAASMELTLGERTGIFAAVTLLVRTAGGPYSALASSVDVPSVLPSRSVSPSTLYGTTLEVPSPSMVI